MRDRLKDNICSSSFLSDIAASSFIDLFFTTSAKTCFTLSTTILSAAVVVEVASDVTEDSMNDKVGRFSNKSMLNEVVNVVVVVEVVLVVGVVDFFDGNILLISLADS